jgi:hypothetical protein
LNHFFYAALIGIGATATMDLWGMVRAPLMGVPAPNYGLVGRWLAGMSRGRFRHASIAAAPAVRGEQSIGWIAHYVIGVVFAALLLAIVGVEWIGEPTLLPALLVGVGTVAAPFLIMQPGMGAGIAASRTPNPGAARVQSLLTHFFFGLGLYISGWAAHLVHLPGG